jgi:hypothetical protein
MSRIRLKLRGRIVYNPDATPEPGCGFCGGSGHVPATPADKREYWAEVNREYGRRRAG